MSGYPGTFLFQPNNTATLFGPTQVPVLPGIQLNTSNGYNPLFAGTPFFWLDGSDAATTQLTSGRVTTWLDKSGNGRNATQATTSNAPTLVTAAQNGLNALSFSGTAGSSGNCLNLPDFTSVPFTMFLVCKYDTLSAQSFAYSMVHPTSGFSPTFRYSGGGTLYTSNVIGIDNGGGGTRYAGLTEAGAPLSNTNFNIHNFQLPAGSTGTLFMNGVAGCNVDGFTYSANASFTFPTIGGYGQDPDNSPFNGTLCEMVWYNSSLTTADRQKIEGYLAWKWGLQSQLPAAHPYKTINIYAQPQLVPLIQGTVSIPLSLSTRSWLPTSLSPSPLLWFDAADTTTITGTSQVTSWTNKGTTSMFMSNLDGSVTSGNKGPYGQNFLFFSAANLQFNVDLVSSSNRTWIFVLQNTTQMGTSGDSQFLQPLVANIFGNDEMGVSRSGDGLTYSLYQSANQDGGTVVTASVPNPLNVLNIYTVVRNSTTANQVITRNGNSLTLIDNNTPSFGTGSRTYRINRTDSGIIRPSFHLYEVVFLSRAVSPLERQQLEGYLAWKWGAQGDLPSSHLFKNYPPPPA